MSAATPAPLPERAEQETLAADLAGAASFFIDPGGAARCLNRRWFWVTPLVLASIVGVGAGYLMMPFVQQAMERMPMPPDSNPEAFQKGLSFGLSIMRVMVFASPIFIAGTMAAQAAILFAASSVAQAKVRFLSLFNLTAGCALISTLGSILGVIVLKSKGEISSMAELQPPFGLDIFLPEGTNKFLLAFVGYFSVFQLWWIVMMVLIFSTAFGVSRAKAASIVAPIVILFLLLKVGGAFFQR